MLDLKLINEELEKLKFNKEEIRRITLSRAIYNESLSYNFSEEDLIEIDRIENVNMLRYYMKETVAPRLHINENMVLERYNKDKKYFEENKISFKDARDMIMARLNEEVNYGLEQDLVKNLVSNMEETITFNKKDIINTKGNPDFLKDMVLIALLKKEAEKNGFFKSHTSEIDIMKKEIRINFYLQKICSANITVSQEQVSKYYVDHTKEFSNTDINNAYQMIAQAMYQKEFDLNVSKFCNEIAEKYKIDEIVASYFLENGEVIN